VPSHPPVNRENSARIGEMLPNGLKRHISPVTSVAFGESLFYPRPGPWMTLKSPIRCPISLP